MGTKGRIFLVEDHALVREGLRRWLGTDPNLEVVGEATNGSDAIGNVAALQPDLVITDLSMPGARGVSAIDQFHTQYPHIKILVLTIHLSEEYIYACLRAGANGYIVKDASREEFMDGVQAVLQGRTHLCACATQRMIGWAVTNAKTGLVSPWESLSNRERQVLQLIAEGYTNKRMAKILSISPKTVEKHRANLMSKLDVHSTAGLTAFAIEKGLTNGSPAGEDLAATARGRQEERHSWTFPAHLGFLAAPALSMAGAAEELTCDLGPCLLLL
jgi:DNA-binding NarL/FixJ family response regulator